MMPLLIIGLIRWALKGAPVAMIVLPGTGKRALGVCALAAVIGLLAVSVAIALG